MSRDRFVVNAVLMLVPIWGHLRMMTHDWDCQNSSFHDLRNECFYVSDARYLILLLSKSESLLDDLPGWRFLAFWLAHSFGAPDSLFLSTAVVICCNRVDSHSLQEKAFRSYQMPRNYTSYPDSLLLLPRLRKIGKVYLGYAFIDVERSPASLTTTLLDLECTHLQPTRKEAYSSFFHSKTYCVSQYFGIDNLQGVISLKFREIQSCCVTCPSFRCACPFYASINPTKPLLRQCQQRHLRHLATLLRRLQ